MFKIHFHFSILALFLLAILLGSTLNAQTGKLDPELAKSMGPHPELPPPNPDDSHTEPPHIIGWKKDQKPVAPPGFKVQQFAGNLESPRKLYILPNGDVLVAEATGKILSANRITLLHGMKADGTYERSYTFLNGLNQPFGMLVLNGYFYVANTNAIFRYPYRDGQVQIEGKGEKILDLPGGGYHGHWTRNLIANPAGTKIFVAVGSDSNAAEDGMKDEARRANILEINPDGSGERIFASGLRNPIGLQFYPGTQTLWAVVNERDRLGDKLVPDYLTHVQDGAFYGWPYFYYGSHEDPRQKGKAPANLPKATIPDFAVGNHTASLSVDFYSGQMFPRKFRDGVFIGQHGSWNSAVMRGYDVYFIPFKSANPADLGEPFLTGFIADGQKHEAHGRPVDVVTAKDGSLLVSDDEGGKIWRVSY